MSTQTPRHFVTGFIFIVTLLVSTVAAAAAPAAPKKSAAPAPTLASYIFVCRDAHGALDRRACHHMGRSDPQRVTLAMR